MSERSGNWATTAPWWVTLVVGLAAGGGGGSLVTGQSVAAELREAKAQILGRLAQLEDKLDAARDDRVRLGRLLDDHEKRLRALEGR